jgi:hypothetical protein
MIYSIFSQDAIHSIIYSFEEYRVAYTVERFKYLGLLLKRFYELWQSKMHNKPFSTN